MSGVKRQKVFWDDGGETIKRFHEVDAVLASDYDRDVIALSERNDALEFQAAHNYEVSQLLLAERDQLKAELALALKVPSVAAMHSYLDTVCAKQNVQFAAERDELRIQVEAMRDLLREVAPHFAAPPGLGYLYQQIDIALQVNQMNKYQVKFFYLATGMEGHADIRSYGIIEASSAEEAESKVIEANFPNMSDKDKNFVRGCLTATLVSGNENRPE